MFPIDMGSEQIFGGGGMGVSQICLNFVSNHSFDPISDVLRCFCGPSRWGTLVGRCPSRCAWVCPPSHTTPTAMGLVPFQRAYDEGPLTIQVHPPA